MAIALPKNSAYKPHINDFSRRLVESGIHEVIRKKYAHMPLCVVDDDLKSDQTQLTLDHITGIVNFGIACCIVSFVALLFEYIVNKCNLVTFIKF